MRRAAGPLTGLATVLATAVVVLAVIGMFQGSFTRTVPLTVLSQRAGLVMDPDAKVKLLGVQVGRVASIDARRDGTAALHLEMDPAILTDIPANVRVDIASTTVFGAKSLNLVPPEQPSPETLKPGQVLDADHVAVEINTIFEQLTSVLSKIQPEKLNATLGAISTAFNGRGADLGRALTNFDRFLAALEPSLQNLNDDFVSAHRALNTYADVSTDLIRIVDNATAISRTIVDEQHDLDALLVSVTGLADIGNEVIGGNRQGLTDVLHLLVPTTDLTNRYNAALTCGLDGLEQVAAMPPATDPGVVITTGFMLGIERYRYPADLPKVAAKGGPQCADLPIVPPNARPAFVVTDTGVNPAQYGNQGILLNSDGLKQLLFGPLDGPPRNTAQIGQPG
jgi:virulence factor Mce-like protein